MQNFSTPPNNTVRLAKRLAAEHGLSRSTAEQYIEGGFVSVDGTTVEVPGARVAPQQRVLLTPNASLFDLVPVTLLLHKPPGYEAGLGMEAGHAAHSSRDPAVAPGARLTRHSRPPGVRMRRASSMMASASSSASRSKT